MALRAFAPMVSSAAVQRSRKNQFIVDDDRGTAEAGAATTITLQAGRASAVDSAYVGHWVFITAGTGAGQAKAITAYVGSTRVATVSAWGTNPDNTSVYCLCEPDTFHTLRGRKWATTYKLRLDQIAKFLGELLRDTPQNGA